MSTVLPYSKKSVSRIFLVMILLYGFTMNGWATTYYISPAGDDAVGDGSVGNPWKTLHYATQTVITPGDIIHVKEGIYMETEQCVVSPEVSIEGEGIVSVIQSLLTDYFKELLSLKSPEGTMGNQHISNLKFDGQNLATYWGIWVAGRSNVSIYNCVIENFRDRGVIFSARSDFYEYPPEFFYSVGNKFYSNIVNNCAEYSDTIAGTYGRGCLNIGGQDSMLIYDNVITQNQRLEGHNGWPIKYVNHGYLKNCKIYNNVLTKIPYGGIYPGQTGWDFCIELFNVEGLEISGNTIHGSIDLNFNYKGNSDYSVWIHHNVLSRDTLNSKYESGVIFEFGAETAIVEYNIMRNISCGVQFNTRDSSIVSNCKVRKNLMANLASGEGSGTAGGIMIISEGTNSALIDSLEIDNNTIVATTLPDREPWVGIHFDALSYGFARNVKIRNNIVVGFAGAWLQGSDTATNMDEVHILVNDSYLNGNNNLPLWPAGAPTNYVDTPYNLPGIDPMFDSSTNSYSLQPISPVIDLGIIITGIPFLGSGPDLGYAEYGGGPPLAAKLSDFYAMERNGSNLLQWSTITETNSNYFDVERSNDARYYQPIGRVTARGNSTTEVKYYFTDNFPPVGKNYYRLAQVDRNNKTDYSKIVSVVNKDNHTLRLLYTSLSTSNNTASFIIISSKKQAALLAVTDVSGRLIFSADISLLQGNNSITKNIPALSKGIYYVRVFTKNETLVRDTFVRE